MNKQKYIFKAQKNAHAEDSRFIEQIANKRGIKTPSIHLGFFRSIYARIEDANKNGVRLAREAVQDALPGLIGSQVNFEHLGAGFICGTILDAVINENDEIEVVYSFFKDIYPSEYKQSIELAKKGELSVSFELLAERTAQEHLADGTIRLHDIDFTGCGHLMSNPPAEPSAKIFEFAKEVRERVSSIENKELVCASQIIKQCDEILKNKKSNKENNDPMTDELKKKVEELRAEFGELAKDVSDEELLKEDKVTELREAKQVSEKKESKEDKKEDEKSEKESDEKKEEAKEEDSKKDKEEALQDTPEVDKCIKTIADNIGVSTEMVRNTLRRLSEEANFAEALESEIETLKSTLEAKDSEIQEVRENAEKIGQRKTELKDNEFASEFKDEDYLNDEKVEKAKQDKKEAIEKSEKISERKEELKDNEFAKDFTDEDYLNDFKVENAKLKKENADLKNSDESEEEKEEASEDEKTEEKASEKKKEMKASNEEDEQSDDIFAEMRKNREKDTTGIKSYKRPNKK